MTDVLMMKLKSLFVGCVVISVAATFSPTAASAEDSNRSAPDQFFDLKSAPVPVTRTFPSGTQTYQLTIEAILDTYGNVDFVTFTLENERSIGSVKSVQRFYWQVDLKPGSFSPASDLRSATLSAPEMGQLGSLMLTYSATTPATQNCAGNYTTSGSVDVQSFTLNTGLTGFGTVTEAPASATLNGNVAGCGPFAGPPCLDGWELLGGPSAGASYATLDVSKVTFGTAPVSVQEDFFTYRGLGPHTRPSVQTSGVFQKELNATGLPLSTFSTSLPTATVLGYPGSGFVGEEDYTQVGFPFAPQTPCEGPNGGAHTVTNTEYDGSVMASAADPYRAQFDTGTVTFPSTRPTDVILFNYQTT